MERDFAPVVLTGRSSRSRNRKNTRPFEKHPVSNIDNSGYETGFKQNFLDVVFVFIAAPFLIYTMKTHYEFHDHYLEYAGYVHTCLNHCVSIIA
ncbi:MAG: hypothetical protein HQK61_06420 [Desulfamplus sp.]|nr:hypothetical protein [Desulfamplus sp.]